MFSSVSNSVYFAVETAANLVRSHRIAVDRPRDGRFDDEYPRLKPSRVSRFFMAAHDDLREYTRLAVATCVSALETRLDTCGTRRFALSPPPVTLERFRRSRKRRPTIITGKLCTPERKNTPSIFQNFRRSPPPIQQSRSDVWISSETYIQTPAGLYVMYIVFSVSAGITA